VVLVVAAQDQLGQLGQVMLAHILHQKVIMADMRHLVVHHLEVVAVVVLVQLVVMVLRAQVVMVVMDYQQL
jgi:hypothetical protein